LLFRDGRYYTRNVVPKHLRGELGVTEKRIPPGEDRKSAIAQLPAALVLIDGEFDRAARRVKSAADETVSPRPAMTLADMTRLHYPRDRASPQVLRAMKDGAWKFSL
jgi:hypothetical protein